MTTPEDRVVWESDEEALYRAAHGQDRTESDAHPEKGSTVTGDATGAREARYAEAIWGNASTHAAARAVMAVADAEQAELRAEVDLLRETLEAVGGGIGDGLSYFRRWQDQYRQRENAEAELRALPPYTDLIENSGWWHMWVCMDCCPPEFAPATTPALGGQVPS